MARKAPRTKNKDNARRSKRKTSVLNQERVDYVDYKDVNLLRRFMSDRAKIRARRVTGNDAQQQREVAKAIKNAREMALLPYATRVVSQRSSGRGDRGDRPPRDEAPPRPDSLPPGAQLRESGAPAGTDGDVEAAVAEPVGADGDEAVEAAEPVAEDAE